MGQNNLWREAGVVTVVNLSGLRLFLTKKTTPTRTLGISFVEQPMLTNNH